MGCVSSLKANLIGKKKTYDQCVLIISFMCIAMYVALLITYVILIRDTSLSITISLFQSITNDMWTAFQARSCNMSECLARDFIYQSVILSPGVLTLLLYQITKQSFHDYKLVLIVLVLMTVLNYSILTIGLTLCNKNSFNSKIKTIEELSGCMEVFCLDIKRKAEICYESVQRLARLNRSEVLWLFPLVVMNLTESVDLFYLSIVNGQDVELITVGNVIFTLIIIAKIISEISSRNDLYEKSKIVNNYYVYSEDICLNINISIIRTLTAVLTMLTSYAVRLAV